MIAVRPLLASVRADRGFAFWLWWATKLALGLGQMCGAVYVSILIMQGGFSRDAFDAFLGVAALTTASLLLFRVLGWRPVKRN